MARPASPPHGFHRRLLLLVGLAMLPWLLALAYEIWHERSEAQARALSTVREHAELIARDAQQTLGRAEQLLKFLSQRPEIMQADARACGSLLEGLIRIDPLLVNVGFADAQGKPLCASVALDRLPSSLAGAPWFQAALSGNAVVYGQPQRGVVVDLPVVGLALGVDASPGRRVGVLVATLNLHAWSESFARHGLPQGSSLLLQDQTGTIVARYPDPARWVGLGASEHLRRFQAQSPLGAGLGSGLDGVERFYAVVAMPVSGWSAVVGMPTAEVLAHARQEMRQALGLLAVLALVAPWLALRFARRLMAPLDHLAQTARAITDGQSGARADESLPGEFQTVAVEFNRMLDARRSTLAQLEESERRFRDMLDSVDLLAVAVDTDGRVTYCNDFMLSHTGWQADDLLGQSIFDRLVPPDRQQHREAWLQALRSGEAPTHNESPILGKGGQRFLVRWSSTVLCGVDGSPVGRASIGEDVTEQRGAEQQVQRLTGFMQAMTRTQRAIIRRAARRELLQEACDACVDAGHALVASAWFCDLDDALRLEASAGPFERVFGPPEQRWDPREPRNQGTLTARAVLQGQIGIDNDHHNPSFADVRGLAVFPLHSGEQTVGVLKLNVDEPGWFDKPLVELLTQLCEELSFALDNLRREALQAELSRQAAIDHARFKTIFEAAPLGIALRDATDGRMIDVNPTFAQRIGLPREALLGHHMAERGIGLSPEDNARMMAQVREHSSVRDFEAQVRDPDGSQRDVLINGELIEHDGRPALLTFSHDITDRRHMLRALAEREQQLAGIVETAMDAILTVDARQRIVMFNRAASQMFGVPATKALGQMLETFIPPALRDAHRVHMREFAREHAVSRDMSRRQALTAMRGNGEVFPIDASISKLGEGDQLLMTVVVRDRTERLAAAAAREARIAAEAASQAKTDFLARMSHELRTPLNAMLGFAQLLGDDPREPLSERQRHHLELTREAGWHLLALIDDVLDVSRIEAGRLEINLGAVPLRPLLDSALSVSAALAARHRVELRGGHRSLPESLAVQADPTRLRQVVLNLLSNGCKYNRPGGVVEVRTAVTGDTLVLEVVDNGVGMTSEQLAHLFEPFNRLGREGGHIEGTGIGLHLTRELVHLMGGTIEVRSTLQEGTAVRLRLPLANDPSMPSLQMPAAHPAPPPASVAALAGSVLYIEDNPVNLMLVEQFLARWPGVRLTGAETGRAGLACLRDEVFDLLLLDMQLPDMHGVDVLAALHADPPPGMPPVVALSASAMPEAVDEARRAGAAEYWTKPLDLNRLAADLRRYLREDRAN
ncbi:MAG: PAS domain S-box protein [Vitreoscilla sp.]|nr:PAS domain S-box protein [Vitreoscilla sp.]